MLYNETETELENQVTETENDKNLVKIGYKEANVYVLVALRKLMNGNKEIILQGRGMLIPKCITVALILKANYMKDINVRTELGSQLWNNEYVPDISIRCSKFSYVS
jgi:DNA-binding protein Alba